MTGRFPVDGATTRRSFLAAAGAVALAGCVTERRSGGGGDAPTGRLSGEIGIAGSSTVYPLAVAATEEFQSRHPGVNISLQSTGSGAGFQNFFCVGKTEFNNASRPIQPPEEDLCGENGVAAHEIKVATDAVTVIVNNENDWVDCMTVEELRQIWEPDPAERWSEVNDAWPDRPIQRFGAAETSGTFDYFTEVINGEEGTHTQDYQATERDNDIVSGVEGSPGAIGYLGFAYYSSNQDAVTALAIDDGDGECVEPTLETAKSGAYTPLSRPLFTYVAESALRRRPVAEFARFFLRKSADESLVADEVGYVPNTEAEMQSQLAALDETIEGVLD